MNVNYEPIPFDHTYLLYNPKDIISVGSVYLSLVPIGILCFYLSWFLITREIEPVLIVGGQLASEIFNSIIKKIVKQPRPDFHRYFGSDSSFLGYGMPSAHSQFMGFFATYFTLSLIFRITHLNCRTKALGCLGLISMAMLVASSRVYLLYHTVSQVLVGLTVGSLLAIPYFVVVYFAREMQLVEWLINWPIIKHYHVKDSYYYCYSSFKDEYDYYLQKRGLTKKIN